MCPSARTVTAGQLETAQQALVNAHMNTAAAEEAAAAAQAAHAALQQQIQNAPPAQAQAVGGGAAGGNGAGIANLPMIDRPAGTRWSIYEAMQLTRAEYAEIQVSRHPALV